jgi:hypothetical protein
MKIYGKMNYDARNIFIKFIFGLICKKTKKDEI